MTNVDENEGELIVQHCADCARQVLSVGRRRKPEHFINMIDQVGVEDLRRIGRNFSLLISILMDQSRLRQENAGQQGSRGCYRLPEKTPLLQ